MFADCRLGLKPPKKDKLAKLCRTTAAELDPLVSRCPKDWAFGKPWDSDDLGNRDIGLCGPAAAVNWLKLMALAAGRTDLKFTADDAERFYRDVMGWDGTEANDDGVVLLDMMWEWTQHPIGGIKLDGFRIIGHGEAASLATAVTCAPLVAGATLTKACQGTDTWDAEAADSKHAVWGGHAYLYHSDSPGGGNGKSWGQPVFTTPDFRVAQWNEAYLPICFELMPHIDAERLLKVTRLI